MIITTISVADGKWIVSAFGHNSRFNWASCPNAFHRRVCNVLKGTNAIDTISIFVCVVCYDPKTWDVRTIPPTINLENRRMYKSLAISVVAHIIATIAAFLLAKNDVAITLNSHTIVI